MYYQTFLRRYIGDGQGQEVEKIPFAPTHFQEAGLSYAPLRGMPELEALILMNKWNTNQVQQLYVYGVE
jgi:hypothetical protein